MLHQIAFYFSGFPNELAVFLVAMTPVLEQRVAIPLGILVYHMPIWKVYAITMLGNIGPVLLLLYHADRFHAWVEKNSGTFFGKKWANNLKKAQDGFQKYEKYGMLGLVFFVVSPLPGSGIFTGAMLAFLLGVPFRHSWAYLTSAVLGSGLVTLLLVFGLGKIF
jgi:uncharacterized membrane protein